MTRNSIPVEPAASLGALEEVDGRRLFAHALGGGGPVVVFLPGAGAVGLDFFAVQQRVSRWCTAVVYDRGGTGYSDPVALPRSAAAVATELHALLHAPGVARNPAGGGLATGSLATGSPVPRSLPGPLILVAHSLGGAYAHRFTQLYPGEVAGLVWVDGFHRDWAQFMPAAATPAADSPSVPGFEQIQSERIRRMRPAARALFTELTADFPRRLRESLIDAHAGDEWLRVGAAERGSLAALAVELRAGAGLPDVPLIALTAGGTDPGPPPPLPEQVLGAIREGMGRMAAAVAASVTHGEHRVVADAGHHQLCFTRPEVVAQAIRDVADRAAAA